MEKRCLLLLLTAMLLTISSIYWYHQNTEEHVFAIIGDSRGGSANARAVAQLVNSWNPEIILTLGDNNDIRHNTTLQDSIGQFFGDHVQTGTFYPVLGNHDWEGNAITCTGQTCTGNHQNFFTLPGNERYYTFTYQNIAFFMLDSDPREPAGTTLNSIQGTWFTNEIQNSHTKWNIVAFHHPTYSSGSEHGSNAWMDWNWSQFPIDVVLAGHDHVYERIQRENITYIINGAGGSSLHNFKQKVEGSKTQYVTYGAQKVTVTKNKLRFQFYNVTGALLDDYTLKK